MKQKALGLSICCFALIRLVSHPAAQNRTVDYVMMAVMFGCGVFMLLAKQPKATDKK